MVQVSIFVIIVIRLTLRYIAFTKFSTLSSLVVTSCKLNFNFETSSNK